MIDVNVYLSQWPFRRLPDDTLDRLVSRLKAGGVEQAWVGSFDALLHRDIGAVNARLAQECAGVGGKLLVPFGAVNVQLPDWQEDVRRCAVVHKMPGIRLHPNYHGYTLSDDKFAELLDLAKQHRLIVQIALRMEDTRTQHPLMQVDDVDAAPLLSLLKARKDNPPIVLLNAFRTLRQETIDRLTAAGDVYFEVAMLEGVAGVARLTKTTPLERVLFGSYAPFFYWKSAALKLQESALGGLQREAISRKNVAQLMASAAG